MFIRKPLHEDGLEMVITELELEMKEISADTKEYSDLLDKLERLHKLKKGNRTERVSPDAKATIVANLLGIALILHYEQINVVSSKALGFIMKLK